MLSVEHVSNIARKSFLEKFSSSRSSRSSVTSEEKLRLAELRGEGFWPKRLLEMVLKIKTSPMSYTLALGSAWYVFGIDFLSSKFYFEVNVSRTRGYQKSRSILILKMSISYTHK